MITLQKLNIQKIVASQEAADKLISQGYHVVDTPEQLPTETPADNSPAPPQVYICSTCGKEYKTQEGLDKHMADKHADKGGDKDGGTADPTDGDDDGRHQDGA